MSQENKGEKWGLTRTALPVVYSVIFRTPAKAALAVFSGVCAVEVCGPCEVGFSLEARVIIRSYAKAPGNRGIAADRAPRDETRGRRSLRRLRGEERRP